MTHQKWQKWHIVFLYRVQIQTLKHKLDYYLTCRIRGSFFLLLERRMHFLITNLCMGGQLAYR